LRTSEFGFLSVFSLSAAFFVWMMEAWTLEMTAAPFLPPLHLEMAWMMFLHHGKWTSSFETKRKSLFGDFWQMKMILHNRTLKRPFSKLKKHSSNNLYMLYPMVQSVLLACIEIDKKIALQGHYPSMVIIIIIQKLILAC
jgi:hypothetical protein